MLQLDEITKADSFIQLVQKENFVGWIYNIDYDSAKVMTNDLWKSNVLGVPHNCFLVAASFNPDEFSKASEEEQEVILLRVIGTAKLPQDDDIIQTKIDHYQQQDEVFSANDFDDLTKNQVQFGGLDCRVLGTFFKREGKLWLGSDIESFSAATKLNVYKPRKDALKIISNFVDPLRKEKAEDEAKELGIEKGIEPFQIGTVRYTSTDRLHRKNEDELVPVSIQPSDFLARRTAVLGMTRTGKSNMIKHTVSVVKKVADDSETNIGQIIYDLNGEYANANKQDKGAISEVYPDETVRYRMLETDGFEELQNNFYIQLNEGLSIIRRVVKENKDDGANDVSIFLNTSLDEPDQRMRGDYNRWEVRVAAYKCLLNRANFAPPQNTEIKFTANKKVREEVKDKGGPTKDPKYGLTLQEATDWFLACREAHHDDQVDLTSSSSNKDWLDNDTVAILNMLARENQGGTFIKGYGVLTDAKKYHSPRRKQEVGKEIYKHLENGKIVILDLSVGNPELREKISEQIATDIFNNSMQKFVRGESPPNIVVYTEEAHNLIGKGEELSNTWPRLAKEGAKYRISLVYATQEVSSVHPNILANTENWFITHLNNENEIKELTKFYDFDDFSRSLLRAQDVGFARVKTLSSPFVIPTQINLFDAEKEKERQKKIDNKNVEV